MGPLSISSAAFASEARDLEASESRRERVFAELVLPEMLASCMAAPRDRVVTPFSLLFVSPAAASSAPRAHDEGVAESWRPRAGGLTGPLDARVGHVGNSGVLDGDSDETDRLITQIEAGDLGTIRLVVERTTRGLKVSLGVDNPETAASAEMQRSLLEQSLRASGLTVASVTISRADEGGTLLAQSTITHGTVATAAPLDEPVEPGKARPGAPRLRKRLNVTG